MLGKMSCCKETFRTMLVRCQGRGNIVLWLGLSLSVSLCHRTVNFMRISVFSLLGWGRMARGSWSWAFPFPPYPPIPQPPVGSAISADKALVKQFSLMVGLNKKNRMIWHISNWFLFPSSCWKCEGIFLRCLLWEFGWTLGWTTLWVLPYDCSLEFLTLRLAHVEAPAIHNYSSGSPSLTLVSGSSSA